MSAKLFHSMVLIITIALAFLFSHTALFAYELQLTSAIFILYIILKKLLKGSKAGSSRIFDSTVFTLIIINLVNSTGGLQSGFFFLNYFLIFAVTILLEPVISVTMTLALTIFYLFDTNSFTLQNMIPIFSLPALTIFALYLGEEIVAVQKQKKELQRLRSQSLLLTEKISEEKSNNVLFTSLVLKNHLNEIKKSVENFTGDHDLVQIKRNVNRLEGLIEEYENS